MKKILGPICCMMLCVAVASAQDYKKLQPTVKAAAKKMNDALVKKDYKAFIATTHPKVVESTEGGIDKLAIDLEKQIQMIETAGNKIVSAWPGDASTIIDTAGELQCTIPQYMKMKLVNGIITTQTTLMGFSSDKGKTWHFVDATDKSIENWRTVFPNLSSQLVLKPAPEPKFVPNK